MSYINKAALPALDSKLFFYGPAHERVRVLKTQPCCDV